MILADNVSPWYVSGMSDPRLDDEALHGQAAPDGIHESTQALLDRLERLADLRDRGLLGREEYETAKETIVRELETRQ